MASAIAFKLFAPNNKESALIGSFSNWKEIPMEKDKNGYFHTVVNLDDGVYQYKFRVRSQSPSFQNDQWVEVIDPYATDVDEAKKNAVIRIKDGKRVSDDYIWQHDDKLLPDNHQLVIYEMHVADFSGGEIDPDKKGRYLDAIAKLDHLSELGINAIELMPINEYPGDYSWGYKVRHFFATESSYGSIEDLKRFIDECHARNIRVILDGIYNHTDEECPLLRIDRNYWYYEHMHYPEDPDNYWGPEFNYNYYDEKLDTKPAWKFIGDVVRFWVQEYHIDGIRFDAVRQLDNYEFLDWIGKEAKKAAAPKPFYNIAEHIPDTSRVVSPEGPLDACWHESFRYYIIPHVCGEKFELEKLKEVLDPKRQGYATSTNVINYLATHDREHMMRELGDRGIFGEDAFRRTKLGAVLLLTAMGVPMLWMGEEFGEHKRKSETVTQPKKIAWPLLERPENRSLFEYYKRLITLRKQNSALQHDRIEFFYEDPDNKVLAYVRWDDCGNRVVVAINFSDRYLPNYRISHFPAPGKWLDWINDAHLEAGDDCLAIDLPEYEAKVLVHQY